MKSEDFIATLVKGTWYWHLDNKTRKQNRKSRHRFIYANT